MITQIKFVGIPTRDQERSFACDDVQATYRQLRARGVAFVSEPQKQPWGEFATFKDPDGNQFVLSSS